MQNMQNMQYNMRKMQQNMQKLQNNMQNNSATSIFQVCILCILQYAKYAKYVMMTYAYSVFCVIFCIFFCIFSFIFCIFSCIFCIFSCIFCLARQTASATLPACQWRAALAEPVPEPGQGRPARIRQRPRLPRSLPRRPASRGAWILGGGGGAGGPEEGEDVEVEVLVEGQAVP